MLTYIKVPFYIGQKGDVEGIEVNNLSPVMRKPAFCHTVFQHLLFLLLKIAQSLHFLNPEFQELVGNLSRPSSLTIVKQLRCSFGDNKTLIFVRYFTNNFFSAEIHKLSLNPN